MTKQLLGRLQIKKARNERYWYADFIGWHYFIIEDLGDRWQVLHRFGIDEPGVEYYVDKDDADIVAMN